MACVSVVYYCEFRELRVLKHFVDVHNYFVFAFVRFLLYVVYVFALCSPYLEDNKVSIYLSTTTTLYNFIIVLKCIQMKVTYYIMAIASSKLVIIILLVTCIQSKYILLCKIKAHLGSLFLTSNKENKHSLHVGAL